MSNDELNTNVEGNNANTPQATGLTQPDATGSVNPVGDTPQVIVAPAPAANISNPYNDIYGEIAKSIITAQEAIIGPLAIKRAQEVESLSIDPTTKQVTLSGEPEEVVERLVKQYSNLFGQISIEVCRNAAARYTSQLDHTKLPASLR